MNLFLADIILVLHFAFVLCVVVPVPLIIAGRLRGWGFVRNKYFRLGHVAMIGFVTVNTLLGDMCPLTILENYLRESGGGEGYGAKTFISYWIGNLLFYDLPLGFFAVLYSVFMALVVALFWLVPVRWKKNPGCL